MVAPYFFDLTWMPRNQKLPPKEAPLLAWEIYVARSTPSTSTSAGLKRPMPMRQPAIPRPSQANSES
jgi:hypothetical protein